MNLSEIHSLSTIEKRQWLRSAEGLTQLRNWVSEGLTVYQVARMLQMSSTTLSGYRRYDEIGAILGYPQPQLPDLSRPPAYRIICGLDYHNRGQILSKHYTALELWQTPFIRNYFKSFGVSPACYYESYLVEIRRSGRYTLSNTFTVCYCKINRRGIVKILKPTP